jgi:hypothetical protein
MNIVVWIRRQRDRPIAEHERRIAMASILVLLTAIAVLLTLTQPPSQARRTTQDSRSVQHGRKVEPHNLAVTRQAERVAGRFLTGYLSYTCGRTPANQIASATRSLIASLQAHPPRVSPAARARHPRIVSIRPIAAAPVGGLAASAVVNDGELVNYTISLLLAFEHGRLLVTGLEDT